MSTPEHYFTAEPASPAQQRTITVRLAGQTVEVRTAAGIFSPAGVDQGTSVLLRLAPAPPTEGNLLDLGCGWGPIALTLALRSPEATVYALDVNERALDLLRTTAASLGLDRVQASQPDGIPEGLRFDVICSTRSSSSSRGSPRTGVSASSRSGARRRPRAGFSPKWNEIHRADL